MEDPECNGKHMQKSIQFFISSFLTHPTLMYRNETKLWNYRNRKLKFFLLISGEALEEDDFDEEEEEDEEGKKIVWKLYFVTKIVLTYCEKKLS